MPKDIWQGYCHKAELLESSSAPTEGSYHNAKSQVLFKLGISVLGEIVQTSLFQTYLPLNISMVVYYGT